MDYSLCSYSQKKVLAGFWRCGKKLTGVTTNCGSPWGTWSSFKVWSVYLDVPGMTLLLSRLEEENQLGVGRGYLFTFLGDKRELCKMNK